MVCSFIGMSIYIFLWNISRSFSQKGQDPRRMYWLIDFICSLINKRQTNGTTIDESLPWYFVQKLKVFQWRIPSIWSTINDYAKQLIDHRSSLVRDIIAE